MMLPIVISLSLARGSYFFCAAAGSIRTVRPSRIHASTMPRVCVIFDLPDVVGRCRSYGSLGFPRRTCPAIDRRPVNSFTLAKMKMPHSARRGMRQIASNFLEWNLALFPRHHRSEQLPALAREAHHLQLLERREIGRAGLDPGSGQIHADLEVQVGRLPHDVFAGEVVAALSQDLLQSLRHAVTECGRRVLLLAFGIPLGHEGPPFVHGGIPFVLLLPWVPLIRLAEKVLYRFTTSPPPPLPHPSRHDLW